MPYTLWAVRQTDRQVVDAFAEIAEGASLAEARLEVTGIDGFTSYQESPKRVSEHDVIKSVLQHDSTLLTSVRLRVQQFDFLHLHRPDNEVVDRLTCDWSKAQQAQISASQYAHILALAKEKLRAIDGQKGSVSLGPGGGFEEIAKARFTELRELQVLAARVATDASDHRHNLDQQYDEKVKQLEKRLEDESAKLEEKLATELAKLQERIKELDAREAEIDRSDSKAARRKLRDDLRRILKAHSESFRLSGSTRRLRWPVGILLVCILVATGWLAYSSFGELASTVADASSSWWRLGLVSIKQVFFAATFLAFVAYTVRWFDSWSKRHADAEFQFKQLELDVDRASWVVEVAQEWHKEQGKEVPPELLAQLSSRLFEQASTASSDNSDLGSLLGAASRLKLKGAGAELELDRRGISRFRKG